ncbi:hypothetical protein HPP92_013359 [Vanilla planifolia]|uniref:Growth-regulating factor n=1 Tax=Vanilla planifolia TaxID=51239 RepID=A0A835QS48_VANPL|nr:hypothetical protein HPP92_013359 [Vanilla planifolia]
MDYPLWRSNHQKQSDQSSDTAELPLFATETKKTSNVTAPIIPGLTESTPFLSPRFVGFFNAAQWQELQLQTLIYKYIRAGASVPLELILPLKRSVINASSYAHLSRQNQHHQPAVRQSGYWSRCAVDPEPGRCRRTDGKKWRCSRDVVVGQRYCDRHVHHGKNHRSRKLVEVPKTASNNGSEGKVLPSSLLISKDTHFFKSEPSANPGILPLTQNPQGEKNMDVYPQGSSFSNYSTKDLEWEKCDGRVLRRFIDERPKSDEASTISFCNKITSLGETSDISLKLSTGKNSSEVRVLPPACNWVMWETHGEASIGGPLAEVLRPSPTIIVSPKSVLWKSKGSASETSSTST